MGALHILPHSPVHADCRMILPSYAFTLHISATVCKPQLQQPAMLLLIYTMHATL